MRNKNKNVLHVARRMPKVLSAFLIFFALATVFLTIESSAQGAQLVKLEEKRAAVEYQNEELRSNLVFNTSLSKITEDAEKLGMVRPEKLTYINGAGPTSLVNREKPVARVP